MRGTCFVSLALLVVLFAPALPVSPPATAQAGGDHNLFVPDPLGDVGPFGLSTVQSPVTDAYGHVDITGVEIGNEDPESFQVILGLAGFENPTQAVPQAVALTDFRCYVRLGYASDTEDLTSVYSLYVFADLLRTPGTAPDDAMVAYSWSYRSGDDRHGAYRSDPAGVALEWDAEASAFVMTVEKSWVPVWPGGYAPGGGDVLELRYATCRTDITLHANMTDYVEVSEASRYAFRNGGQSSVLRIGFDPLGGDEAGPSGAASWEPPESGGLASHVATIGVGAPSVVPVYLRNDADSRKLVQLSAAFQGEAPDGWNLTITPTISIPANDVRTVNLVVAPPPSAQLGASWPVVVEARAAGEEITGTALTRLRVAPVLGVDHDTVYVHSEKYESPDPIVQAYYDHLVPPYVLGASLLESDADYDDEPAKLSPAVGFSGHEYLAPLVRPVRLDGDTPVKVQVAFEGDPSRTVRVEMYLFADGDNLFAIDHELAGDGVHELEAYLPVEGQLDLEAGARLEFQMEVEPSSTVDPAAVHDVYLKPVETRFTLPVVRSDQSMVVTDGRFLPSLALAKGEEANTYLNPGKEYAFDLVLSNDGIETDDLRLSVASENATGWDAELQPGRAFRVQPGNSTPFSLVVRAPVDAAEGEHPVFLVTAQSRHDENVRSSIELDVLLTTNVQVEEKRYRERDGQLDPLDETTGDAPAPEAALLALGLVGLLAWTRRRR